MIDWEVRILHLGLGRFHRAHQAAYYQRLADAGDKSWGCASYSMRSDDARDQMLSVHNRYPVFELGSKHEYLRWIESIRRVGSAISERENCLKDFSDPKIEIVTLTITEKGYTDNSFAIALVRDGIQARMLRNSGPLTIISCDNLRGNGKKLAQLVMEGLPGDIKNWAKNNIRFPSTMVDRIVPALTDEKINFLEKKIGKDKTQVVATEEFSQWIIEDNFAGERPSWEKVGVEFVQDVTPYEEVKLRLLNASHSYLAYGGLLRGRQFVHEAIEDGELASGLKHLLSDEVIPLLKVPTELDLNLYCKNMLARFTNHHLPHQLIQIAMDGSQKLPQRFFSSLLEAFHAHSRRTEILRAITFWMKFSFQILSEGKTLQDPATDKLRTLYDENWASWPSNVMNSDIFPMEIPEELKKEIIQAALS